jgi:predicted protein tyrosine phosphatase
MATLGKVDPAFAPQGISFKPEKVDFSAVSIFKSHCFKVLGTAAVLAASVTWILPAAASLSETTLDPLLIKSLLGTILVGVALIGLKMKKEILYEVSIGYTIWGAKPWWTEIDEVIVLGALPLEHQINEIKALGVTHVIALVEPFELKRGIVRPAQQQQWEENGIIFKLIPTADFYGVPKKKIAEANDYIETERQKNPKAKFYIHCKAGRGRSTTIVLCNKMKRDPETFPTKEITYDHLKTLRSQINLNKNQMFAAQDFIDSGLFVT